MGIPLLSEAHDHLHWAVVEENHLQIEGEDKEEQVVVQGVVVLVDPRQTMKSMLGFTNQEELHQKANRRHSYFRLCTTNE